MMGASPLRNPMFNRLVLLAILLMSPLVSHACLNTMETEDHYDRTINGQTISIRYGLPEKIYDGGEGVQSHSQYIRRLISDEGKEEEFSYFFMPIPDVKKEGQEELDRLKEPLSFEQENDKAVALVKVGRLEEAVSLLLALEKKSTGHYSVAANLGTAYELQGKDELALEWIRKGIERNLDSHQGSEWLHVRILETKIKLKEQPDWLKNHSVAGLDFGQDALPSRPSPESLPLGNDGKPLSFLRAHAGLGYQLSERLRFGKPQDPVVADLLMDYGQGAFLLEGGRWSSMLLTASRQYGVHREGFDQREQAIGKWVSDNPPMRTRENLDLSLVMLALTLFVTFAWLKYNAWVRKKGTWTPTKSMVWLGLAGTQLVITLSTALAAYVSYLSFEWRVNLALLSLAVTVGIMGHLYGLGMTRGKIAWLGVFLWPAGLLFVLPAGVPEILMVIAVVTIVIRVLQASKPPVWLDKPPINPPVVKMRFRPAWKNPAER